MSKDPGWNDPPKLFYNPESVPPVKPRTLLNKRVPFSLNSSSGPPAEVRPSPDRIPLNLPPSIVPGIMVDTHFRPAKETTTSNKVNSADLEETTRLLEDALQSSPELGKKLDDVRKRIDLMQNMWAEGKLNVDIQTKMLQLAKDITTDPASADILHKELMISHPGCVGSWMVGIKQLIMHYISKNDLLNINEEENN